MVQVYVARHAAPAPRAPESLTTVVSPFDLTPAQVGEAVTRVRPHPPIVGSFKRWQLLYPEMPSDPNAALVYIKQLYLNCERCHLADRRTKIAFFKGNLNAAVLALGEGPGKDEDTHGVPFIGKSGRLEDELLREGGLDPERDVCWTNIVGCRPCDNRFAEDRKPSTVEAVACSERLLLTLRAVRPRIVLCLGAVAATLFWPPGEEPPVNTFVSLPPPPGIAGAEPIIVGVFRHPAYLLRIGQQPNMYGEWFGARHALRQLRGWLPATKVPVWPFGLRYVSDLATTEAQA